MADRAAAVDPEDEAFSQVDRREDIILNGRYRIAVSEPLRVYDTPTARAFAAEDLESRGEGGLVQSGLFARINHTGLPGRDWEIDILRELRHPHLMRLVDIGATPHGGPGRADLTAVFETPAGGRLMPSEGAKPMAFRDVKQRLIAPLCSVLEALHGRNIYHRAIHPENLFLSRAGGHDILLGECVSSAAGHNLPAAFQPLERASATPLMCGVGDRAADVYSFGLTIVALLAGKIPGAGRDPEELLQARLKLGSLEALCASFRFSRQIERLLIGMLADNPLDRWSLTSIAEWLSGRHITTAADRVVEKPKRLFTFNEQEYRNPVAIADAFNRNWSDAKSEIQSGRLEKWMASDRDRLAGAEAIISLRERHASASAKLTGDALISRVCMTLDPHGPLRFKGLAVSSDGMGVLLAYGAVNGIKDIVENITAMLDQGLPAAWIAMTGERRKDMAAANSDFIRYCQYVRNQKLGGGIERCLYEMSPSLYCLHPRIAPLDSGDATALLTSLAETCTFREGEMPPWTDRHVVAFLAARLHPEGDSLLASLALPGKPQAADAMIGMAMVALAQDKLGVPLLPRLTRTAGASLYGIVEVFYSETRRKALRATLDRELGKGDFSSLLKLLNNADLLEQDREEYRAAGLRYGRMGAEIVRIKGETGKLKVKAALAGRRSAAWVAFFGLIASGFMSLAGFAG